MERQHFLNERHEGDDVLVAVARFLQASAMEADAGYEIMRPSAADLWRDIDDLPWPLHGGPAPQPDVE